MLISVFRTIQEKKGETNENQKSHFHHAAGRCRTDPSVRSARAGKDKEGHLLGAAVRDILFL